MGKVFTITEGLENMGAMKTGGQGSVYKGRRMGPIITAVKLLPTPIHTESADDKNFRDFQNEVQKLRKVNEDPNPNVVKILSSGITESGSFPFIEMEYIEGPDLEELLKPPHDPVFTLKEIIKVAEQLANALAHCHRVEVKHGDIKSNNVKLNIHTGNYILLDFGLAAMSDEQRRTSLRHAGAIEFMAPEQNEGTMLFQTDVYSYGVILYELLAGSVPFPLKDKGETARNTVMVAHMEVPVPDVLALRKEHLPQSWSAEKQGREMNVPSWLLQLLQKCLEKKPEARFRNGIALQEFIWQSSSVSGTSDVVSTSAMQQENERLRRLILQYQNAATAKEQEIQHLKDQNRQQELNHKYARTDSENKISISKSVFFVLLFLTLCLATFAAFNLFFHKPGNVKSAVNSDTTTYRQDIDTNLMAQKPKPKTTRVKKDSAPKSIYPGTKIVTDTSDTDKQPAAGSDSNNEGKESTEALPKYKVINKAYFHNEPDETTRRNAFLVHWNNAVLTPIEERDGFIYVIYTNERGQTSKGWLKKSDLQLIE
ncbi:MAG TPA: serine/threonine-protein kinase [Flavisolibacter sp.]|jgi:serine/threonine-protein kinase|nr:serine/threonine-protein kinase [Flavisolibacter sp.]